MHCLIVTCVYPPEPVVSAQTSAQIAKILVHANHTVTVVTSFPNRPAGKIFCGFSRKFTQRERVAVGNEIVRCFSTLSPKSSMVSRLLENLSFGLTGGLQVLVGPRPNVIYANTWPLVATGILFLVAKLRRIPVVISVQDVYPEALVVQKRIREDSILAWFMRWIDGVITRSCAHVIVISERFDEIYRNQRKVLSDRISLIPNWIDADSIDIRISTDQFRSKQGIDPKDFLLVYGGNISVAAGVETVIESMRYLSKHSNVRLLVAGAGSQLIPCKAIAESIPGDSIIFHSPWPEEETSEVLCAANVLVLPTRGSQSMASVPSKLIAYMLAARPVIVMAMPGSELASLVDLSDCGWVIAPDQPELLARKIKEIMMLDPAERQNHGEMGRRFALQHLTKDICLPKIIKIIEEAAQ